MHKSTKVNAGILLILAALVCLTAAVHLHMRDVKNFRKDAVKSPVVGTTEDNTAEDLEDDGLPHDKLFITEERQSYSDGDLTLIIPYLDIELPIYNGVDLKTLAKGVGLYDYAQLPGEGNRNVSIAGHRNGVKNKTVTDDAPFYYIDLLKEGDLLYLRDDKNIYVYNYETTYIVEPDDWGPIYSQGYSCLTLTSCTPIGSGEKRIIVRGRLLETVPLTEDYEYQPSEAD